MIWPQNESNSFPFFGGLINMWQSVLLRAHMRGLQSDQEMGTVLLTHSQSVPITKCMLGVCYETWGRFTLRANPSSFFFSVVIFLALSLTLFRRKKKKKTSKEKINTETVKGVILWTLSHLQCSLQSLNQREIHTFASFPIRFDLDSYCRWLDEPKKQYRYVLRSQYCWKYTHKNLWTEILTVNY